MAPKLEDYNKKMTKKDIKNDFISHFIEYGLLSEDAAVGKGLIYTMIDSLSRVAKDNVKHSKKYIDRDLEHLLSLAKIVAMRDYIMDSKEYQDGEINKVKGLSGELINPCKNKFVTDLESIESRALIFNRGLIPDRSKYSEDNSRGYLKESIIQALKLGYDATDKQIEKVFDVKNCLEFCGEQYLLNHNGLWKDYITDTTVELKQHARDARRQRAIEYQIAKAKADAEKDIASALNDVDNEKMNIVDKNATLAVINQVAKEKMNNSTLKRIPILRWFSSDFRKEHAAFKKTSEELAKVEINPNDIGRYLKDTNRTVVDLYDLCVSQKTKEIYASELNDYDLKLSPEPKVDSATGVWREPEDLNFKKNLAESLIDKTTVKTQEIKEINPFKKEDLSKDGLGKN